MQKCDFYIVCILYTKILQSTTVTESDATFFCFLLCSHNPTKCWYLWLLDICSTDTIIFEDLDPYRHNRNIFYLLHPAAAAVIYCKRTSLNNCDLIVQLFYNKTTWNTNCQIVLQQYIRPVDSTSSVDAILKVKVNVLVRWPNFETLWLLHCCI